MPPAQATETSLYRSLLQDLGAPKGPPKPVPHGALRRCIEMRIQNEIVVAGRAITSLPSTTTNR